jgi:hypothetical protein
LEMRLRGGCLLPGRSTATTVLRNFHDSKLQQKIKIHYLLGTPKPFLSK